MNFKLGSITFRLIELKAFSASISKIPSVLLSLNISCIACIVSSDPATCPPRRYSNPATWTTSFFNRIIPAFSAILLYSSPTPVSLSPGGLSNGPICMLWMTPGILHVSSLLGRVFQQTVQISCTSCMTLFQMNVILRFFSNHQREDQMVQIPLLLALLLSKWGTHRYLHILLDEQVVSLISIILLGVVH